MSNPSNREGLRSWKPILRITDGKITLREGNALCDLNPTVRMREEEVEIGCAVLSREVIEFLARQFKEHFPIGITRFIQIQ